ncbi:GNAT family protein [Rhodovulum sp. FJ3]|uniref:GNAT family N-acetyltransferase n=1 Tax=Rhodovulum sp. FJ3 TaxID=3079053 RepID=UPI00293DE02F|nr:GNAT family protein [Rhodovulum sp. FJ3]MDV4167048.1 GNAT family protein [Rhodovulum sp. FJ3]
MQKVGFELPGWVPPRVPDVDVLDGPYVRLERLSSDRHGAALFQAYSGHDAVWTYLPVGPFHSSAQYQRWVRENETSIDPYFFAIQDKMSGKWAGVASFLRVTPNAGTIEVGFLTFSPLLQRTPAATEAMFLMMQWAFEAGYRRYEWKCDALNLPSRRAAQRLGFSYEGVFRQAAVVKGRNRDTAWFSVIDREWPALKEAFHVWLAPENFRPDGSQVERLSDLTRLVRANDDPTL